MQALGVEDQCFGFGLGALGRKFLALKEEGHSGGVAYSDCQLALCMEGSSGGRDESFLGD